MCSLSNKLADFVLTRTLAEAGQDVSEAAMDSLRDSIGCLFAGMDHNSVQIARAFVERKAVVQEASAIGLAQKVDASYAALINGTAINALDFDDVAVVMNGHPSAVVLPAAMAAAQKYGADGRDFLEAYITGVETAAFLGIGCCPESFSRGWHCTALLGLFGAVAAVGKLAGLNHGQLTHAFGIAASEASGVKANLGTGVKPLHCGRSAQKAFDIVELARLGCTANPEALEGKTGLGPLVAGRMQVGAILEAIEEKRSVFLDPGVQLKRFASCKHTQTGICALLDLLERKQIGADQIRSICCEVQEMTMHGLSVLDRTPDERKPNLRFCLATAAAYGTLRLEHFETEELSEEVRRLMDRTEVKTEASLEHHRQDTARITVVTEDGCLYTLLAEYAGGERELPLRPEEKKQKFEDCCRGKLTSEQTEHVWVSLDQLTAEGSCRERIEALLTPSKKINKL